MASPKGEARRDRKSGHNLVTLHRQDSRELGEVVHSLNDLARVFKPAREMARFLGCSRRTARRAATYARRLADGEVGHG